MSIRHHVMTIVFLGSYGAQGLAVPMNDAAIERRVAAKLRHCNQSEIALAEAVASRTSTREVQDLANMIVADHKAADTELFALVKELGVTLEEYMPASKAERAAAVARELAFAALSQLSGQALDAKFLEITIKEHEAGIAYLKTVESQVAAPEFKAYIAELLSIQEKHLEQAKNLATPTDSEAASSGPRQLWLQQAS